MEALEAVRRQDVVQLKYSDLGGVESTSQQCCEHSCCTHHGCFPLTTISELLRKGIKVVIHYLGTGMIASSQPSSQVIESSEFSHSMFERVCVIPVLGINKDANALVS